MPTVNLPKGPQTGKCRCGRRILNTGSGLVSRTGPEPADRALRATVGGRVMALVVIQSHEDVALALELAALEPTFLGVEVVE